MSLIKIIAIDGPAASGKTTLGKKLADALGYLFFDTGVMYRAITWVALQRAVNLTDEVAVSHLAEEVNLDIRPPSQADGRSSDILADGEDITWAIRTREVDANVSRVSAYPGVRRALSLQQRRIGLRGNVVMVGRDIGTVVLPEAGLKLYLDASVEERARRRYRELMARGEPADYADILAAMQRRDHIDSTRSIAPLRPAEDAIILNSDGLNAEEVLAEVIRMVKDPDGSA
jgi:cytidylate kinase